MCIEDIRMGRRSHSYYRTVTATDGDVVLVASPNQSRTSLVVSFYSSNYGYLYPGDMVDPYTGLWLTPYVALITVRLDEFGQSVTGPWKFKASGGTMTLFVHETLLEDR